MRAYFLHAVAAGALSASLAGCVFSNSGRDPFLDPPNSCGSRGNVYAVDTGAQLAFTEGVDAGYYITYLGGGEWHLEWTCDTRVSQYGCNFTGTIIADEPSEGPNAVCVDCESNDIMTVSEDSARGPAGEKQMIIDFDTITSTAVDGVDFFAVPGTTVSFDMDVDGIYHPELVFLSSAGALSSPGCVPFALTPTKP
jgi:hypothetical protein